MSGIKAPHHKGTYHVTAMRIRQAAKADPSTVCWRCGRTLAQHPRHKSGRPPHWTAGHVVDGVGGTDAILRPEVSTCNYTHGARLGNARQRARRSRNSRPW